MTDGEWLLISEFARRTRLPVSTLRYYDRVGLLRPAEVDPDSGYRRYHDDQVAAAVTIAGLRAINSAPEVIARILRGGPTAATAIAAERRRLAEEISERTLGLAYLDAYLDQLDRPVTGAEVRHVRLAPGRVPALHFTTDAAALTSTITRRIATLRGQLRRRRRLPARPTWGALLPLDVDEQVAGHVFVRAPVPPADALASIALPHGRAIELTHDGPHGTLPHAYHRLLGEAHRQGLRVTGPVVEEYHPDRTRLVVPVR